MKKIGITFLLSIVMPILAFAYPSAGWSLMELIQQSPIIVVAEVLGQKDERGDSTILDDGRTAYTIGNKLVTLKVRSVLKGSIPDSIILVSCGPIMCPAPASYPENGLVITFLYAKNDNQRYHNHGLSYGVKIMESQAKLNHYKRLIKEGMTIAKIRDPAISTRSYIDWIVKCSANAFSRKEGLFMLSFLRHQRMPDSFLVYRYESYPSLVEKIGQRQVALLQKELRQIAIPTRSDLRLSLFFNPTEYGDLKRYLINRLPLVDEEAQDDIMRRLVEITRSKELYEIVKKVDAIYFEDPKRGRLFKDCVRRFIVAANK